MNDTSSSLKIIDGIYDIQPPADPGLSNIETAIIYLLVITVIISILLIVWTHFYSTKNQAKRNIKKLQLNYSNNKINTHDAVYQLTDNLCKGLKINSIGIHTSIPEKINNKKSEWLEFTKLLSEVRYNKDITQKNTIDKLVDNSLQWLSIWP